MKKEITFKRSHVELIGCALIVIGFSIIIGLLYYVFIYTPDITQIQENNSVESNK